MIDKHKITVVYPDLYFVVIYKWNYMKDCGDLTNVDFEVYEILEMTESEESVVCEKEAMCVGFIKWDGCCDFHIERTHFCGYYRFNQLNKVFAEIYYKVEEICKVDDLITKGA
jgi:hypothetical protein